MKSNSKFPSIAKAFPLRIAQQLFRLGRSSCCHHSAPQRSSFCVRKWLSLFTDGTFNFLKVLFDVYLLDCPILPRFVTVVVVVFLSFILLARRLVCSKKPQKPYINKFHPNVPSAKANIKCNCATTEETFRVVLTQKSQTLAPSYIRR